MPARLVDGEALWTSSKLKKVRPVEFRLHYANWLPLAEANGWFEVDFDIIRAKVYPVIDPKFSSENVQAVFREFVRVGLLTWLVKEERHYGYFVGIGKKGRLPGDKHLKRYKNLPDCPIPDSSGASPGNCGNAPDWFGLDWYGLDRSGEGLGSSSSNEQIFSDKKII